MCNESKSPSVGRLDTPSIKQIAEKDNPMAVAKKESNRALYPTQKRESETMEKLLQPCKSGSNVLTRRRTGRPVAQVPIERSRAPIIENWLNKNLLFGHV
jgi:hypothetical protein